MLQYHLSSISANFCARRRACPVVPTLKNRLQRMAMGGQDGRF